MSSRNCYECSRPKGRMLGLWDLSISSVVYNAMCLIKSALAVVTESCSIHCPNWATPHLNSHSSIKHPSTLDHYKSTYITLLNAILRTCNTFLIITKRIDEVRHRDHPALSLANWRELFNNIHNLRSTILQLHQINWTWSYLTKFNLNVVIKFRSYRGSRSDHTLANQTTIILLPFTEITHLIRMRRLGNGKHPS